jgi:hypothetical protein
LNMIELDHARVDRGLDGTRLLLVDRFGFAHEWPRFEEFKRCGLFTRANRILRGRIVGM